MLEQYLCYELQALDPKRCGEKICNACEVHAVDSQLRQDEFVSGKSKCPKQKCILSVLHKSV